jgi:hypothetical protein
MSNEEYPYAIPNSSCRLKPKFEQLCAYCIGHNCKAYIQLDETGHDGLHPHIQTQAYKETEKMNQELPKYHCHHCYFDYNCYLTIDDKKYHIKNIEKDMELTK